MIWQEALKRMGYFHIVSTGAGAGLQQTLWEIPGCSWYLSGCSFPYDQEEQADLLGFMPEHFCSEEAAVDLASAAYMKAYRFGKKAPIGVGITATVASEREHKGDHRAHVCVITEDRVRSALLTLKKGVGAVQRLEDGKLVDTFALAFMMETACDVPQAVKDFKDTSALARERFFLRPFFTANGKRLDAMPTNKHMAIMPGAYNPPHEGHFGTAQNVMDQYGRTVTYEVTAEPPHKEALTVQELLKRAKLLQGHDRLFTRKEPLYLDKARRYPSIPIVLGADAMVRMLDPKWGVDLMTLFKEFRKLETKLLIAGRTIGDKFVTCDDISSDFRKADPHTWGYAQSVMLPIDGRFDISSTELRNKLL